MKRLITTFTALTVLVLATGFFESIWAGETIDLDSGQYKDHIFEAFVKSAPGKEHKHSGLEKDHYYDPNAMFRVMQYVGRLADENLALRKEVERLKKEKIVLANANLMVTEEKSALADQLAETKKENSSLLKNNEDLIETVEHYKSETESLAKFVKWSMITVILLILILLGMTAWVVTLRSRIAELEKYAKKTEDSLCQAQQRIKNLEQRLLSMGERPSGGRFNPPVDGVDPEERIV